MVPETSAQRRRAPIRSSVQWDRDQYDWLLSEMQRLGLRSVAAVVSMMVQKRMNAEQPSEARP